MNKLKQTLRIATLFIFLSSMILGGIEHGRAVPLMGITVLVSVASDGTPGNSPSNFNAISADGRFVAFDSWADNLVGADVNESNDIFVHDRQTSETTIVSVATDGTHTNNCPSEHPDISNDGMIVAFNSCANTLVENDTNTVFDIFVHDRWTGETTRVSVASDGTQADGDSYNARISSDGRYVAFESTANNLVEGNENSWKDVFVHDRQTGETTLVSVSSDGTPGNEISASPTISYDGRYMAFESRATNLMEGDANGVLDIFVHNRQTGETTIVSVATDGTQANQSSWMPTISDDGNFVAFETNASNLVAGDMNDFCDTDYDGIFDDNCWDIFVHDRSNGETRRVSVASDGTQGDNASYAQNISGNGRYVTFESFASNLVDGDANNFCDSDYDDIYDDNCMDIFIHDQVSGETILVSVASDGTQGNEKSYYPSITVDGIFVSFASQASNLVPGIVNDTGLIYLHEQEVQVLYFTQLPVVVK